MKKENEYALMINSQKSKLEVQIPSGPLLKVRNCWDYRSGLTEVTFKTNTEISVTNDLMTIEFIDLRPTSSIKVYKVTVLRQPKSKLLDKRKK